MRRFVLAASLLALAGPLAAQASPPAPAPMAGHDHDAAVQGAPLPAGWQMRLDRPQANAANLRFVRERAGYHFTAGPAAILWQPADSASGTYTVRGTFTQTKAPTHPEAYGLFLAGTDLHGANQSYLYFEVRGDGKYLVKHRAGAEVHTITDWTDNAAIAKADAAGRATNALEMRVLPDGVHLFVNGTAVQVLPADHTGPVSGIAGLRLNHNLDVQVTGFRIVRARGHR
ncbi:MAG: hypothetical protein JWM27_1771 [Gemmatimonadetes bacterium]|nr:hypothetical protein [Gemmatimonadota bacterium]